jgi:hypothetical protein
MNQGMQLDQLYDAVRIPGSPSWLDEAERQFAATKVNAWKGVRSPSDASTTHPGDWIDFARLTPALQVEVIHRFANDSGFANDVRQRNTALCDALRTESDPTMIVHNRNIVATKYGAENQRQQLLNAYRKAISNESVPATGVPNTKTMLELVEHSRPFYPCRVEQLD